MEEKKIKAIVTFVKGLLDQTKESLQVSEDIAFLLLDHYHWDQNELASNWEASKDELIKSFHINLEGEKSLESQLAYKDVGFGKCPVCSHENKRLYELYCGQRICKECIVEEDKNAVIKGHIPVCHQECNAEFLAHDVERALPGSKHAKAYRWWRLNRSFSESRYMVSLCPNPLCRHLIVQNRGDPTNLVRCPKCEFAFCLDCLKDSHAPLCCCNHAIEFTEDLPAQLKELEEEEENWFKRESKLIEYRFQNKNETIESFDVIIRAMENAQKDEQEEVERQIKNNELFQDLILTQITEAEDKIKGYIDKNKSPEKIDELNKKIMELRDELDRYKKYKEELEKENQARKESRKKDLDFEKGQKQVYLNAVLHREKYDVYIKQFRENLDKLAEEKSKQIPNEDDCIRKDTIICPSCKLRFYKVNPCCEVTCVCGYDFCTNCNEPWVTHKKGYCECQNDKAEKKIDYTDQSDMLFYPCRYNLEKKAYFNKWKRFHESFVAQKAKYDELHQKFLQYDAEAKKESPAFVKLTKKLQKEKVEDARLFALKLVNNALFAESVSAWGYVATFYIRLSELTQGYIEKLEALDAKNNELIALLNEPESHSAQEFEDKLTEVKAETDSVLQIKF